MSERVLIMSASDETIGTLTDIISESLGKIGFDGISAAYDSASVKDRFNKADKAEYGLVVISAPLEDEYGISAVSHITENSDAAVIMIVAQKNADAAFEKLRETGAMVLPKPVNKISLLQSVRFMCDERKRRIEEHEKYSELSRKLSETKMIDRAKCVLVEYLKLSEAEAHKHMQKQAMDLRQPLIAVARDILKTYEYLE